MNSGLIHRVIYLLLCCVIISSTACTPFTALPATPRPSITIPAQTSPLAPTVEEVATATVPSPTATSIPPTPTKTPSPPDQPVTGIEVRRSSEYELAIGTGAYWLRRNALNWALVEPFEGVRDWAAVAGLEEELILAAQNGMNVILVIRDTPGWAQKVPGASCSIVKPEKLAAFSAFVTEAVLRYSVEPYRIKVWEIGNEPDIDPSLPPPNGPFGCWGDIQDTNYYGGGYYAEVLKSVYPAIKSVDAQAQVLVGGLLLDCDPIRPPETSPGSGQFKDCTSSRYLEGILNNGGGDFFDGVSFHAYDYYYGALGHYSNANWSSSWDSTGPSLIVKARYIKSLLNAYGYPGKFLMNTETALLCSGDGEGADCFTEEFNNTKAYYLVQTFTVAQAEGLVANIWYSLAGWRGSGLINNGLEPNLAYSALLFNSVKLDQVAYWGEVTRFPGVRGFEFHQADKTIWVLWSGDGEAHTITFPSIPEAIYDLVGNSLYASQGYSVTLAPVYVEWRNLP